MNGLFLLSGGLDSLVVLASRRGDYDVAYCVGLDYGQRHARELSHAAHFANRYGATFHRVSLPGLGGSALTGELALPTGLPPQAEGQAATVVPGRNLLMLATAVALAVRLGCHDVLFGANADDATVYLDCRPAFVAAAAEALRLSCGVRLLTPLLGMSKREVVALGRRFAAPLEESWSCYAGGEQPCGCCGACLARETSLA